MLDEEKNIFAETNFRNQAVRFGIKTDDRRRHMYVIGKSGSGKTNLLETMAINDILAGKGLGIIDPHGEFAEKMLLFIPKERLNDVIYFNPSDINFPVAFNPLEQVSSEFRHLVASGIMGVFKKIWVDMWSARMEYILNNTLLALLEYPDATILGVMRMFSDPEYRKVIVSGLKDPVIKGFWVNEYARYSQKFETEAVAAIQNKIGQFVSNPLIRNIIGQPRSSIDMRKIMDGKKILIANLSKGKMGEDNSRLLGAMMITRIQLAAMSRVDIPENQRNDFFLYVDEFQNFATDSFASILSEARKYRLSLILAHQYIEQLDEQVQPAVFGNVGTLACFRVGGPDAEFLEKEFMPEFEGTDLVNLEKYNIYLKLLIDGMAGRPFSATVLPPRPTPDPTFADQIIEASRKHYSLPKSEVEEKIASEWLASSMTTTREKVAQRWEGGSGGGQAPRPAASRPVSEFSPRRESAGIQRSEPRSQSSAMGHSPLRSVPASQPSTSSRPPYAQDETRSSHASNNPRASESMPVRRVEAKREERREGEKPSEAKIEVRAETKPISEERKSPPMFVKSVNSINPVNPTHPIKQAKPEPRATGSILSKLREEPRPQSVETSQKNPEFAVSQKEADRIREALRERLKSARKKE
jgi:hypothetical protein